MPHFRPALPLHAVPHFRRGGGCPGRCGGRAGHGTRPGWAWRPSGLGPPPPPAPGAARWAPAAGAAVRGWGAGERDREGSGAAGPGPAGGSRAVTGPPGPGVPAGPGLGGAGRGERGPSAAFRFRFRRLSGGSAPRSALLPLAPPARRRPRPARPHGGTRGSGGGGSHGDPAGGSAASPGPVPPLQLPVPPQAGSRPGKPSAAGDVSVPWDTSDLGFWYSPRRPEPPSEDEDEEQWIDFRHHWDVSSNDSDTAFNFCAFQKSLLLAEPSPACSPPSALEVKMRRLPAPWGQRLTAEEADRNARELVAEEERVKRKAEKKKLKKKKQKDRKKREKLGQEPQSKQEAEPSTVSPSSTTGPGHPQGSNAEEGEAWPGPSTPLCPGDSAETSGEEGGGRGAQVEEMEDELDLSCTFVCKARQKAGVRLPVPGKEKPPRKEDAEPGKRALGKAAKPPLPALPEPPLPASPAAEPTAVPPEAGAVQQSLVLAARGTEAAQQGRFAEAVTAFSEAVRLNPREHRLFGNRSYCYEKLRCYEEALGDAMVALRLQPGWPKGLFRKGKALRGLQRYAEAASTFKELLRRDGANVDAVAQLSACRALLRQNSPHSWSSPGGVPVSPSLLEAGELPPLPPSGECTSRSCQDKDVSGFVSCRSQGRGPGRAVPPQPLPPTHPARDCYPLWVGNVTARISEKVLQGSFSRFGEIRSLRLLLERRCAFINYAHKEAAEAAYAAMQDAELEGSRLVLQLKHPSHATPAPRRHPEPCGKVGAPPGGLL